MDPLLAALADNGGPTETQALPADSPAVDTADNTGCPDDGPAGRYRAPGTATATARTACDIGAYELIPDTDSDGVLDAFDACINDPEDLDGIEDTDGCPEAEPTADVPAQLPETGVSPGSGGSGLDAGVAAGRGGCGHGWRRAARSSPCAGGAKLTGVTKAGARPAGRAP